MIVRGACQRTPKTKYYIESNSKQLNDTQQGPLLEPDHIFPVHWVGAVRYLRTYLYKLSGAPTRFA